MNTTETSLRVRFALACGWTVNGSTNTQPDGKMYQAPGSPWPLKLVDSACLPPIDANTVREALMQMTEEEWRRFAKLVDHKQYREAPNQDIFSVDPEDAIIRTLKTPPQTLAEIYCEVKLC